MKASHIVIVGAGVGVIGVIFLGNQIRMAFNHAQEAPERIREGFNEINRPIEESNARKRAENVDLELQIVDYAREGYAKPSKEDLKVYIDDFTWAEGIASAHPDLKRHLDRNLAWCQKKLAQNSKK